MMRRFWYFITESSNLKSSLSLIGLAATVALFFFAADLLSIALHWALLATLLLLLLAIAVYLWRRRRNRSDSAILETAIGETGPQQQPVSRAQSGAEVSRSARPC